MFRGLGLKFGRRALLTFALALPSVVQAQSAATAQIGDISAQQENGRVQIVISTNGSVQPPRVLRLTDPERLVFNFAGANPKSGYSRTVVNQGPVTSVRTSLFGTNQEGSPVTRVVIDLSRRAKYETSSSPGKFTISLGDSTSSPPTARATTAPVARAATSAPAHVTAATPRAPEPVASNASGSTLNDIAVSQANGQTVITLKFSGAQNPRTMYLESPRRFAVDFPGVGFGPEWMKPPTLRVNSAAVTAVRSSLFREQPPTVRVVFDQAEGYEAPKLSVEGNSVVVQFSEQVKASAPRRESAPTHVAQRAPAVQQVKVAKRETVASPAHSIPPPAAVPVPQPPPASATIRPGVASGIAVKPPTVVFEGGLLTVNAENTMLIDVLYAIGEKTGASMEVPMAEAMLDRVVVKMGPRKPREVIATLLEGSGFNYFVIENNLGDLQRVVLTPKEPIAAVKP
jgi:AMIN domain